MQEVISIKGMKCMHCAAAVKSALEEIDGVDFAEVSIEKGVAEVVCGGKVTRRQLIDAVEEQGFEAE